MLVYGDRPFRLTLPEFLRRFVLRLDRLPVAPSHDALIELLVDWGEAEAAVTDALSPDRDDDLAALEPWRAASDALADAVCASWRLDPPARTAALAACLAEVAALADAPPVKDVSARHAEGFAYYALYPEQYLEMARKFVSEHSPAAVMCVGLRSIGSILAHVVAAGLRRCGVPVDTRSVRPRGHPFDRRLEIGLRLRGVFAASAATHFVIVDEGPGLSGSSFAAAAEFLLAIGVAPARIVIFPSWAPSADGFRSQRGQATWRRHAKVTSTFEEVWTESRRLWPGGGELNEMSAGEWRRRVFAAPASWPAVQPQHERRKYLRHGPVASVAKFVGLGARGVLLRNRALALSEAGFGAPAGPLASGFLEQPWVDGQPLSRVTGATLDRVADYVALLARLFGTEEPECVGDLHEMIAINLAGEDDVDRTAVDDLARTARAFDAPRVRVDGRMLPHEWVVSGARLVKVDALEHHDDHFWPGCRDIGWDLAGAIIELGLSRAAGEYLAARYQRTSRDRTIRRRLPFLEVAYLAYRFGYASLAAETLAGQPDGPRFTHLLERYRRLLAERLACSRPSPLC